MVDFNELRITPDSTHLIIDVSINNASYYDNMFIKNIVIDTQDEYLSTGPSSNPIYVYETSYNHSKTYSTPETNSACPIETDDSYVFTENLEDKRHVRLILTEADLSKSLSDNMFFVYIIVDGQPTADTPCGLNKSIYMKSVLNVFPLYQKSMYYLQEVGKECTIPRAFINMILQLKAVQIGIKTGNYVEAFNQYKSFLKTNNISPTIKCNCYGTAN